MEKENQGEIFSLFPTPLYTHKLENQKYTDVQNELQPIVDKLYNEGSWGQNPNWSSSSQYLSNKGDFFEHLLQLENMKITGETIMNHCVNYMAAMNVQPAYKAAMTSSWLTLNKPGLSSHIHDHGNAHISGVYWFKTSGDDGDIVFRNTLKALKCNTIGSSIAHETSFPPEQGRLILFPGFLDHSVNENKTNGDRISMSFNILLETGAV